MDLDGALATDERRARAKVSIEAYVIILVLCLAFNLIGFVAIWGELRAQRTRSHDLVDKVTVMWAGVVQVLLDHESRISVIEGGTFRPATVLEKLDSKDVEIRFKGK